MRTRITGVPIIRAKGTMRYWVSQFQVRLEGWVNENSTVFAFPEVGTLPLPFQPEQACCVTADSATGVSTKACTEVPASSHPVVGVGEP